LLLKDKLFLNLDGSDAFVALKLWLSKLDDFMKIALASARTIQVHVSACCDEYKWCRNFDIPAGYALSNCHRAFFTLDCTQNGRRIELRTALELNRNRRALDTSLGKGFGELLKLRLNHVLENRDKEGLIQQFDGNDMISVAKLLCSDKSGDICCFEAATVEKFEEAMKGDSDNRRFLIAAMNLEGADDCQEDSGNDEEDGECSEDGSQDE